MTISVQAAALGALAFSIAFAADKTDNQPFPPHRIADNLYYVGSSDIAAYLVTTPAGDILINAGYETTPALIRDSIVKLGFRPADVKILLNSQAHYDHVAGMHEMQRLTGAKIYSSEREVAVLESGGKADLRFGREITYPPVKVDHVVRDGEAVTLGGVTLVAHMTPGHSIGCTTWTMRATDGGRSYNVVIVGGVGINPGVELVRHPLYPGIADDFAHTFQLLRSLPCDIFLGAHGGYYGMKAKYERMKVGAAGNAFVDPAGYRAFIDGAEKDYRAQLAREQDGR
ncbi:MAG TPA: subclass B3 metallo-beta-lactamase [Candidatus Limnocylindrales bacterium]|nr:subclass B3 metallo-beta-lactamase [Candidatus Limnocylindrales bacterium]